MNMGGRSNMVHGRTRDTLRRGFGGEGGFVDLKPIPATLAISVSVDDEECKVSVISGDHTSPITVISGKESKKIASGLMRGTPNNTLKLNLNCGLLYLWLSVGQIRLETMLGEKVGEEVWILNSGVLKPERKNALDLCLALKEEQGHY
jgi:hypothetical protein